MTQIVPQDISIHPSFRCINHGTFIFFPGFRFGITLPLVFDLQGIFMDSLFLLSPIGQRGNSLKNLH